LFSFARPKHNTLFLVDFAAPLLYKPLLLVDFALLFVDFAASLPYKTLLFVDFALLFVDFAASLLCVFVLVLRAC
jgi:hypothetical protein